MNPKRIWVVDYEPRVPRNVAIRHETSIASAIVQPAKEITQPTPPRLLAPTMKSPKSSNAASTRVRSTSRPGQLAPTRELADCPAPGRPLIGKRVLLVDDDPTVRDSLNDVLVSEGCVVIPAENGQQALDLAAGFSVDIALLDLNMPVKNGWDTFERLTFEHPLIPIIIITARPNQLFTALGAGAGALLEKPMDIPTLLRTMEKLLAESAEQRLARLAGRKTEFHYKSATAGQECGRPAKHR
jgi:CheY-like chemotaxis protein